MKGKKNWPDFGKSGTQITKEIMNAVASEFGHDAVVFRNNVGTWSDGKNFVRYGLAPGSPDIVLILRGSVFVGIEVKSLRDRESDAQKNWASMCHRLSIKHVVAQGTSELSACEVAMRYVRDIESGAE